MEHDEQHAHEEHDPGTATAFWQERYGEAGPIWSGRPNAALVDVASELPVGSALDLGSGEGGDAIWLAARGWRVTAVELATAAVDRARSAAEAHPDVADRITWTAADLTTWTTDATFDLVSACFLHSRFGFPRTAVLRRAADRVAPGGHLLVVGHLSFPSGAGHDDDHEQGQEHGQEHGQHTGSEQAHEPQDHGQHSHDHAQDDDGARLRTPEDQRDVLDLDPRAWTTVVAEVRTRTRVAPDGTTAPIEDSVLLLRRR